MTTSPERRRLRRVGSGSEARRERRGSGWVLIVGATATALIALLPLVWALGVVTRWDDGPAFAAFTEVIETTPLVRWMVSGLVISGLGTIAATLACSMAAYALRHPFRGRGLVVALLAAAALLPAPAAIIGLFEVTVWLGGIDTYLAAALPSAAGVFGVFLFLAAMRGVPGEQLEAARLDGAGEVTIWWRVVMPGVRPATGVFVLLHFLGLWNALLWPSAILVSESRRPVAVGLAEASRSVAFEADASLPMAATLIALVPVAGLFLLTARDLLEDRPE